MRVKKSLTREDILSKVSPYEIFAMYMPWEFTINRRCLSPFKSENNPSFIIGNKSQTGELIFKAFNGSQRGDCINFVEFLFGINYHDALAKIASDFGLIEDSTIDYKKVIDSLPKPKIAPKKVNLIQCEAGKWTDGHVQYFRQYYLEREDLKLFSDTTVYPLKNLWLNKKKIPLKAHEIAFFYHFKDNTGEFIKSYRPFSKELKWLSTIPFQKIHGIGDIKDCKNLIITKSIKEAALIHKHLNLCVCTIQAENSACFGEESVKIIKREAENVYLSLDSDSPGKAASKEINQMFNWKWINVPNKYLEEGIKDWGELVEKHGLEPLKQHFHKKGLI